MVRFASTCLIVLLVLTLVSDLECRRSGSSSRRGSSRGSSSKYSNQSGNNGNNQSGNKQTQGSDSGGSSAASAGLGSDVVDRQHHSPITQSASAPQLSHSNHPAGQGSNQPGQGLGFDNVNKQSSSPIVQSAQPIGWNVPNSQHGSFPNQGLNTANRYGQQGSPITSSQSQGSQSAYPVQGSYGGAYPHNQQPQYNPQQPFQGYHPTSNIGVIPPAGANAGQYYNSIGGYGSSPMLMNHHGGYGGGYGYGGNGYGGLGNSYGGGFGMGGLGGGYGQPHYGSNKWSNLLTGLLVWNLISGSSTRHYTVHNYYNKGVRNETINVEANSIVDCPLNATMLCPGNTTSLCTSEHKILCVTNATIPCADNSTMSCVNSTVLQLPCVNGFNDNGPCNQTEFNMTNINIPCITNASIFGDLKDANATILSSSLFQNSTAHNMTQFCVTTIAVPLNMDYAMSPCNGTESGNGTDACNPTNVDNKSATPWPVVATSIIDENNTVVQIDMTTERTDRNK